MCIYDTTTSSSQDCTFTQQTSEKSGATKGEFTAQEALRFFDDQGKLVYEAPPSSPGSVLHLFEDGTLAIENANGERVWSAPLQSIPRVS